MNISTITTKTGMTAIMTILGTAFAIYTGTLPMAAGLQTIITALLSLFIRDGITAQTDAVKDLTAAAEKVAHEEMQKNSTARVKMAAYEGDMMRREADNGGA